jgi:trk system potassium uptake protein TrkH
MPLENARLFYKNVFPQARNIILGVVTFLAAALLIVKAGWEISETLDIAIHVFMWIAAVIFILDNIANIVLLFDRVAYLKQNWLNLFVTALFLAAVVTGFHVLESLHVFLLVSIVFILVRLNRQINLLSKRPAVLLIASFLLVIFVGTVLLSLPKASATGEPLRLIDAWFTATSATCVTGLVVKDTYGDFSDFGKGIILVLLQIGGLGLMTFGAFFALVAGRRPSIKETALMGDILKVDGMSRITKVVIYILLFTLVCEVFGAVMTYGGWHSREGGNLSDSDQLFFSVFHSVSSFCNAGFSFFKDSFATYQGSLVINIVVPLLIVIGGLGFAVNMNIIGLRGAILGRLRKPGDDTERKMLASTARFTVHTKLALTMTAILILGGFLFILILESGNPETLAAEGMSVPKKIGAALFQSITARTAGFNTVTIAMCTIPTKFLLIILMVVGASPGSTGGGIKTVTVAIFFIALWSMIRGKKNVEIFRRTIPEDIVSKAFVITILGVMVLSVATLALCVTEAGHGWEFLDVLFESASAFGTVGLSTGITPHLTDPGRIVIILLMFAGRIGPLTMVVALIQRAPKSELPFERVIIG